jgi:hypothetical protein
MPEPRHRLMRRGRSRLGYCRNSLLIAAHSTNAPSLLLSVAPFMPPYDTSIPTQSVKYLTIGRILNYSDGSGRCYRTTHPRCPFSSGAWLGSSDLPRAPQPRFLHCAKRLRPELRSLPTLRWSKQDSNPRSPRGRRHTTPGPTSPGSERRVIEHGGGTADREITLLTGGYGISRVPSSDTMLADQRQDPSRNARAASLSSEAVP